MVEDWVKQFEQFADSQKMQECGQPPSDIVAELASDIDLANLGQMYLLLVAVVVLEVFLLVGHHSCTANRNNCNSSCGNISIRLPFHLRTDPKGCGYKSFELDYENNQKWYCTYLLLQNITYAKLITQVLAFELWTPVSKRTTAPHFLAIL
ncbi:hypothetical protein K2173_020282 [Erythroxylum novogranatense]|uniref:Wall-associated receptor kinase galacturonan-binding domain-containing protein n=1 Tax=Erythroxylum novogranatense TaxID=1862640 RepID=A0AAV8UBY5_9ROSI|nr:hypothetical protein K2173_020282 [Erythroxylum novogranatense]